MVLYVKPVEPKPAATREVTRRAPAARRTGLDEIAELHRRLDACPNARFEDVLENLKRELGYVSDFALR